MRRVSEMRGGGEKQKEEKAGKTKGRLVTSKVLTLQAVQGGWRREGEEERHRRKRRQGRGKAGLVTSRVLTLQAV